MFVFRCCLPGNWAPQRQLLEAAAGQRRLLSGAPGAPECRQPALTHRSLLQQPREDWNLIGLAFLCGILCRMCRAANSGCCGRVGGCVCCVVCLCELGRQLLGAMQGLSGDGRARQGLGDGVCVGVAALGWLLTGHRPVVEHWP